MSVFMGGYPWFMYPFGACYVGPVALDRPDNFMYDTMISRQISNTLPCFRGGIDIIDSFLPP